MAFACGLFSLTAFGEIRNLALSVSYHGDMITHPGLRVGFALPILEGKIFKLETGVDVGGFIHPRNERVLFALCSLGVRCATPVGFEAAFKLGAGYKRGYVDGVLYGFASDGTAKRVHDSGLGAFITSAGLDFGWRVNDTLFVAMGPYATMEYPYNGIFLPRVALVTGITYRFGEEK